MEKAKTKLKTPHSHTEWDSYHILLQKNTDKIYLKQIKKPIDL
jgi:hypothetical protein